MKRKRWMEYWSEELFVSFLLGLTVVFAVLCLLNIPSVKADWREAYREGYKTGYTSPDEDGVRRGDPTVPTPETPYVAESDEEAFARGAIDGHEAEEEEEEL